MAGNDGRPFAVRFSMTDANLKPSPEINSAVLSLKVGKARIVSKLKISNGGLVAVGGLVSGILLSTAVLVWASTGVPRKHPLAYGFMRRR